MHNRPSRQKLPDLETVALQGLTFLAEDPDRLTAFLAANGADIGDIRAAAAERGFQMAVFDFLMADDQLLLAFASSAGYQPEVLAGLHQYLSNHAADD